MRVELQDVLITFDFSGILREEEQKNAAVSLVQNEDKRVFLRVNVTGARVKVFNNSGAYDKISELQRQGKPEAVLSAVTNDIAQQLTADIRQPFIFKISPVIMINLLSTQVIVGHYAAQSLAVVHVQRAHLFLVYGRSNYLVDPYSIKVCGKAHEFCLFLAPNVYYYGSDQQCLEVLKRITGRRKRKFKSLFTRRRSSKSRSTSGKRGSRGSSGRRRHHHRHHRTTGNQGLRSSRGPATLPQTPVAGSRSQSSSDNSRERVLPIEYYCRRLEERKFSQQLRKLRSPVLYADLIDIKCIFDKPGICPTEIPEMGSELGPPQCFVQLNINETAINYSKWADVQRADLMWRLLPPTFTNEQPYEPVTGGPRKPQELILQVNFLSNVSMMYGVRNVDLPWSPNDFAWLWIYDLQAHNKGGKSDKKSTTPPANTKRKQDAGFITGLSGYNSPDAVSTGDEWTRVDEYPQFPFFCAGDAEYFKEPIKNRFNPASFVNSSQSGVLYSPSARNLRYQGWVMTATMGTMTVHKCLNARKNNEHDLDFRVDLELSDSLFEPRTLMPSGIQFISTNKMIVNYRNVNSWRYHDTHGLDIAVGFDTARIFAPRDFVDFLINTLRDFGSQRPDAPVWPGTEQKTPTTFQPSKRTFSVRVWNGYQIRIPLDKDNVVHEPVTFQQPSSTSFLSIHGSDIGATLVLPREKFGADSGQTYFNVSLGQNVTLSYHPNPMSGLASLLGTGLTGYARILQLKTFCITGQWEMAWWPRPNATDVVQFSMNATGAELEAGGYLLPVLFTFIDNFLGDSRKLVSLQQIRGLGYVNSVHPRFVKRKAECWSTQSSVPLDLTFSLNVQDLSLAIRPDVADLTILKFDENRASVKSVLCEATSGPRCYYAVASDRLELNSISLERGSDLQLSTGPLVFSTNRETFASSQGLHISMSTLSTATDNSVSFANRIHINALPLSVDADINVIAGLVDAVIAFTRTTEPLLLYPLDYYNEKRGRIPLILPACEESSPSIVSPDLLTRFQSRQGVHYRRAAVVSTPRTMFVQQRQRSNTRQRAFSHADADEPPSQPAPPPPPSNVPFCSVFRPESLYYTNITVNLNGLRGQVRVEKEIALLTLPAGLSAQYTSVPGSGLEQSTRVLSPSLTVQLVGTRHGASNKALPLPQWVDLPERDWATVAAVNLGIDLTFGVSASPEISLFNQTARNRLFTLCDDGRRLRVPEVLDTDPYLLQRARTSGIYINRGRIVSVSGAPSGLRLEIAYNSHHQSPTVGSLPGDPDVSEGIDASCVEISDELWLQKFVPSEEICSQIRYCRAGLRATASSIAPLQPSMRSLQEYHEEKMPWWSQGTWPFFPKSQCGRQLRAPFTQAEYRVLMTKMPVKRQLNVLITPCEAKVTNLSSMLSLELPSFTRPTSLATLRSRSIVQMSQLLTAFLHRERPTDVPIFVKVPGVVGTLSFEDTQTTLAASGIEFGHTDITLARFSSLFAVTTRKSRNCSSLPIPTSTLLLFQKQLDSFTATQFASTKQSSAIFVAGIFNVQYKAIAEPSSEEARRQADDFRKSMGWPQLQDNEAVSRLTSVIDAGSVKAFLTDDSIDVVSAVIPLIPNRGRKPRTRPSDPIRAVARALVQHNLFGFVNQPHPIEFDNLYTVLGGLHGLVHAAYALKDYSPTEQRQILGLDTSFKQKPRLPDTLKSHPALQCLDSDAPVSMGIMGHQIAEALGKTDNNSCAMTSFRVSLSNCECHAICQRGNAGRGFFDAISFGLLRMKCGNECHSNIVIGGRTVGVDIGSEFLQDYLPRLLRVKPQRRVQPAPLSPRFTTTHVNQDSYQLLASLATCCINFLDTAVMEINQPSFILTKRPALLASYAVTLPQLLICLVPAGPVIEHGILESGIKQMTSIDEQMETIHPSGCPSLIGLRSSISRADRPLLPQVVLSGITMSCAAQRVDKMFYFGSKGIVVSSALHPMYIGTIIGLAKAVTSIQRTIVQTQQRQSNSSIRSRVVNTASGLDAKNLWHFSLQALQIRLTHPSLSGVMSNNRIIGTALTSITGNEFMRVIVPKSSVHFFDGALMNTEFVLPAVSVVTRPQSVRILCTTLSGTVYPDFILALVKTIVDMTSSLSRSRIKQSASQIRFRRELAYSPFSAPNSPRMSIIDSPTLQDNTLATQLTVICEGLALTIEFAQQAILYSSDQVRINSSIAQTGSVDITFDDFFMAIAKLGTPLIQLRKDDTLEVFQFGSRDRSSRPGFVIAVEQNGVCQRVIDGVSASINTAASCQIIWTAPNETNLSGRVNFSFVLHRPQIHAHPHILTIIPGIVEALLEIRAMIDNAVPTDASVMPMLSPRESQETQQLQIVDSVPHFPFGASLLLCVSVEDLALTMYSQGVPQLLLLYDLLALAVLVTPVPGVKSNLVTMRLVSSGLTTNLAYQPLVMDRIIEPHFGEAVEPPSLEETDIPSSIPAVTRSKSQAQVGEGRVTAGLLVPKEGRILVSVVQDFAGPSVWLEAQAITAIYTIVYSWIETLSYSQLVMPHSTNQSEVVATLKPYRREICCDYTGIFSSGRLRGILSASVLQPNFPSAEYTLFPVSLQLRYNRPISEQPHCQALLRVGSTSNKITPLFWRFITEVTAELREQKEAWHVSQTVTQAEQPKVGPLPGHGMYLDLTICTGTTAVFASPADYTLVRDKGTVSGVHFSVTLPTTTFLVQMDKKPWSGVGPHPETIMGVFLQSGRFSASVSHPSYTQKAVSIVLEGAKFSHASCGKRTELFVHSQRLEATGDLSLMHHLLFLLQSWKDAIAGVPAAVLPPPSDSEFEEPDSFIPAIPRRKRSVNLLFIGDHLHGQLNLAQVGMLKFSLAAPQGAQPAPLCIQFLHTSAPEYLGNYVSVALPSINFQVGGRLTLQLQLPDTSRFMACSLQAPAQGRTVPVLDFAMALPPMLVTASTTVTPLLEIRTQDTTALLTAGLGVQQVSMDVQCSSFSISATNQLAGSTFSWVNSLVSAIRSKYDDFLRQRDNARSRMQTRVAVPDTDDNSGVIALPPAVSALRSIDDGVTKLEISEPTALQLQTLALLFQDEVDDESEFFDDTSHSDVDATEIETAEPTARKLPPRPVPGRILISIGDFTVLLLPTDNSALARLTVRKLELAAQTEVASEITRSITITAVDLALSQLTSKARITSTHFTPFSERVANSSVSDVLSIGGQSTFALLAHQDFDDWRIVLHFISRFENSIQLSSYIPRYSFVASTISDFVKSNIASVQRLSRSSKEEVAETEEQPASTTDRVFDVRQNVIAPKLSLVGEASPAVSTFLNWLGIDSNVVPSVIFRLTDVTELLFGGINSLLHT